MREQDVRRLILTADDFGRSEAVNEGIEIAHRDGVLTSASLMVAEPAAADAVARARRLPGLKVGLHLTLTDGAPALPPERVRHLVGPDGRFGMDMVGAGAKMFLHPAARHELAAEIEAQFRAFAATGLMLDHVDGHRHFHMHPTIAGLTLAIGRRYGMTAMRAPIEPTLPAVGGAAIGGDPFLSGWARLLGWRVRRAGLTTADRVFGTAWSGAMGVDRLETLIVAAPPGLTEIYLHPATADAFPGSAPGYRYREDLDALVSLRVRAAVVRSGAVLGGYADFSAGTTGRSS